MMLTNSKDSLRRDYDISTKKAEGIVVKNHGQFCIPMPALSEAIYKNHEKNKDESKDLFMEMNRLIDNEFFKIKFISNPINTFAIAKDIVRESQHSHDSRDVISPMDALILAVAASDEDSSFFYTSDDKLIYSTDIPNVIEKYRDELGYGPFNVKNINTILHV